MDILEILSITSEPVSGESIAKALKISRSAVNKQIESLKNKGFIIEARRKVGYTLISAPDNPPLTNIKNLKSQLPFLDKIEYYSKLDSTQTRAKEIALSATSDYALVISETQTRAYGRLSRKWESVFGGIWLSILLRPNITPERSQHFNFILSIAVIRALLKQFDIHASIKWPNDIYLEGRKLAGILTEASHELGRTNWVVIGLGLNANNSLSDKISSKALTLKTFLGRSVNRISIIKEILSEFNSLYVRFIKEGFAPLVKEYNSVSYLNGKYVTLIDGEIKTSGTALGINEQGKLLLKHESGRIVEIFSGEVSVGELN
jgi:BirA family biotin operon repressor/biotin-[acetyl-CoA-carboxylase] ligase